MSVCWSVGHTFEFPYYQSLWLLYVKSWRKRTPIIFRIFRAFASLFSQSLFFCILYGYITYIVLPATIQSQFCLTLKSATLSKTMQEFLYLFKAGFYFLNIMFKQRDFLFFVFMQKKSLFAWIFIKIWTQVFNHFSELTLWKCALKRLLRLQISKRQVIHIKLEKRSQHTHIWENMMKNA